MPFCDLHLLHIRVARQVNDLHTVQQRTGNGVFVIGGGDEQHIAQVKGQFHKMVPERHILFGIKDLQQRRGGITLVIAAQLVDLVHKDEAVAAARLTQRGDDAAGHGTDIGLSVTADLRLVPHAAQAQTGIVPAHAPGDGAGYRGLAHAGRAGQAEDLPLDAAGQVFDGEKLQNALLDLFQAVMVLVQYGACFFDIVVFLFCLSPGQVQANIQIAAGNAAFWGRGLHFGKSFDLFDKLFLHLGGQVLCGDLIHIFLGFLRGVLPLAQFFVDGFDLLPQIIVTLTLVHLGLDLFLNILFKLQDLDLLGKQAQQQRHPAPGVLQLQKHLLVLEIHLHILCNIIGQGPRVPGGHHLHDDVACRLGHERCIFHEQFLGIAQRGLVPFGDPVDGDFRQKLNVGGQKRLAAADPAQQRALLALYQDTDIVAGDLQDLAHLAIGAHAVQVLLSGIIHRHIPLGDQKDPLAVGHGVLHGADRLLPSHIKMEQRAGKNSNPP